MGSGWQTSFVSQSGVSNSHARIGAQVPRSTMTRPAARIPRHGAILHWIPIVSPLLLEKCMRSCRISVAALLTLATLPSILSAQKLDTLARGRMIFASTCRSCHTVTLPPQGGPPMSRIAQRYVQQLGTRAAAAARIAAWLSAPSAEKSLLPKAEVARFGVMPHQPLADAGRFAVAAYVVTLMDSVPRRGRR